MPQVAPILRCLRVQTGVTKSNWIFHKGGRSLSTWATNWCLPRHIGINMDQNVGNGTWTITMTGNVGIAGGGSMYCITMLVPSNNRVSLYHLILLHFEPHRYIFTLYVPFINDFPLSYQISSLSHKTKLGYFKICMIKSDIHTMLPEKNEKDLYGQYHSI